MRAQKELGAGGKRESMFFNAGRNVALNFRSGVVKSERFLAMEHKIENS